MVEEVVQYVVWVKVHVLLLAVLAVQGHCLLEPVMVLTMSAVHKVMLTKCRRSPALLVFVPRPSLSFLAGHGHAMVEEVMQFVVLIKVHLLRLALLAVQGHCLLVPVLVLTMSVVNKVLLWLLRLLMQKKEFREGQHPVHLLLLACLAVQGHCFLEPVLLNIWMQCLLIEQVEGGCSSEVGGFWVFPPCSQDQKGVATERVAEPLHGIFSSREGSTWR